jgi:hypothetical protein
MRKIRLILEDDDALISDKSFLLPDNLDTLDQIDEAVEVFKNEALPQIEQELLAQALDQKVLELKKTVTNL